MGNPNNDVDDDNQLTPDDIVKAEYRELARATVAEQYHTFEFFREQYRKHIQKRQRRFYTPFILKEETIRLLEDTISADVKKLDAQVPLTFSGSLRLKNRREVHFQEWNALANWNEPEASYPVRSTMNWQFSYHPAEMLPPIPVRYDIIIDYETEPNISDKMVLDIEEEIILHVEGPNMDWVRALNEKLEAIIEASRMPVWWRWLRWILVKFKPFFNSGLLTGLATLVPFLSIFFIGDNNKDATARAILESQTIEEKFDLYIKWWATPSNFLPIFTYLLIGYAMVGILFLLFTISYRHVAPPSIIAIGINGKSRAHLLTLYGGIWLLVLGGIVGAIISRFI